MKLRGKLKFYSFALISLILMFSIIFVALYLDFDKSADALLSSDIGTNTTNIEELTIVNDDTTTFNGNRLQELFSQLTGKAGASIKDVEDIGVQGSDYFRSKNGNKDIVVMIGGIKWTATYLSRNNTGSNDIILTLWQALGTNEVYSPSAFAANGSGSTPANMYGSSYMRVVTLNNGGRYATNSDDSTLTSFSPSSSSAWAKFTTSTTGNIVDYIEIPNNIDWQLDQGDANNNDSLTKGAASGSSGSYLGKTMYNAWGSDKLWLPSIAETFSNNGGLWKTSTQQRKANNPPSISASQGAFQWTRSAYVDNYASYLLLQNSSGNQSADPVSTPHIIRPAFHLNLTKANKNANVATPNQGEKTKDFYNNGVELEFTLENVDMTKLDLTYEVTHMDGESAGIMTHTSGSGTVTLKANKVGVYTVTLTPKEDEVWQDSNDATPKKFTFKIVYSVAPLSFMGRDSATYSGSDIEFQLAANYDKTKVTVTPATDGLTFDDSGVTAVPTSPAVLKAKNVGEYYANVVLKDKNFMEWRSDTDGDVADRQIKVTITKKPLTVTFPPNTTWSWFNGTQKQISIIDDRVNEDEVLSFEFSYTDGTAPIVLGGGTIDDTNKRQTNVVIPPLNDGNYTFTVKLKDIGDGKNYEMADRTKQFTVTPARIELNESHILWQYSSIGLEDGALQSVGTWDATTVVEVFYTGYDYMFEIDESVLSGYGVKLGSYQGQINKNCGTNYSTTVTLLPIDSSATLNGGASASFTIKWKISQGKYDLSKVSWDYVAGMLEYNGDMQRVGLINPYSATLTPNIQGNSGSVVKSDYKAIITSFSNSDNNFVTPQKGDPSTYIYIDGEEFPWELVWSIEKARLNLVWDAVKVTDKNGRTYNDYVVNAQNADKIERYEYYKNDGGVQGDMVNKEDIVVIPGQESYYLVKVILKSNFANNYQIVGGETWAMTIGSNKTEVMIEMPQKSFECDGKGHGVDSELSVTAGTQNISSVIKKYYSVADDGTRTALADGQIPTNAGAYVVELSLNESDSATRYLGAEEIAFEITKVKITAKWNTSGTTPVLSNLDESLKAIVGYIYYDAEGNELSADATLEKGKTYKVKAVILGDNGVNYEFVAEDGVTVLDEPTMTEEIEFKVGSNNGGGGGGNVNFDDVTNMLSQWWQVIASVISIILIIIFVAKTIGYISRKKEAKATSEKYKTYYAGATGLFGLAMNVWTAIACTLMGLAVATFAIMLVAKKQCKKAEKQLVEDKEEYERNKAELAERKRDENMQMMFMHMMGGGNNGGQGMPQFVQQGIGVDEMRGLISETVTALLPGMQQMLPAQASTNDELVEKLIEQNQKLMEQLAEKSSEKVVETQIVATNANDETVKELIEHNKKNDERLEQMMRNQEALIAKLMEKNEASQVQTQIIEKVVEKPVEKIMEKEVRVEVPVEKVVEKVVEKPVVHVISTEASHNVISREVAGGAEKSNVTSTAVERSQRVKEPTPKKAPTPRLTLAEAYAKLTKEQKKFFDGLREYAMKKDSKCKEKLATYFTTIGPSTTNPLIKLTIKKGITVALFKMEDEYLKDIRRNASSDGTKMKVKETELPVGDAQAFDTAKDMVDLRVDQIERYNDYLKEQRAMKRK